MLTWEGTDVHIEEIADAILWRKKNNPVHATNRMIRNGNGLVIEDQICRALWALVKKEKKNHSK